MVPTSRWRIRESYQHLKITSGGDGDEGNDHGVGDGDDGGGGGGG